MNLSQLYYFKKLAELQHYTKAAKELFITQPSLSDSIASLEKELGALLFKKCGRNIKLTKSGEKFYTHVCITLNELEKGISIIKEDSNILEGSIDIGCITTLVGDFLPKAIKNYTKGKDSKAKFNIYSNFTSSIIDNLKSQKYDLGFCSKVDNESDLIFIPIMAQEIILLVNKNHKLATHKYLHLKDIVEYPIITYRDSISIGKTIKGLLNKYKTNVSFSMDDEISIGGLLSEISDPINNPLVAISANTSLLKQFNNLVSIKLDIPKDSRLVYMVYNKNSLITGLTESFANYIIANEMNLP